jgi:hypothetical protein
MRAVQAVPPARTAGACLTAMAQNETDHPCGDPVHCNSGASRKTPRTETGASASAGE